MVRPGENGVPGITIHLRRTCGILAAARAATALLAILLGTAVDAASAHFSRLSVPEGLSQSSVESIAEDRYGFLWFGTQEGLNRFDGYEFAVHQSSPRPGHLRDGFIRALAHDRQGDLWVGTASGLQHLDLATARFSESITPPGVGVRLNTLRVGDDGRLWFADSSGGLWTHHANAPRAEQVPLDLAPRGAAVTAIALASDTDLWIAADGQLVSIVAKHEASRTSVASTVVLRDVGRVRVIHIEGGVLWLGRDGAPLLRFDPRTGDATKYAALPHNILTIASAGEGRLWIGGKSAGITRFDPRTNEILTYRHEPGNEDSIADDDVAAIHQDRGGSLWAGAWNGGVSRLDLYSQSFRTLRHTPGQPDSLPDNDVTRMAEGPDGRLWSITRNDMLSVGDPLRGSFVKVPLERDFTAIAFAGATLFAGTTTGLIELDAASARVVAPREAIRGSDLDRLPIRALAAGDDHLWVITRGKVHRIAASAAGEVKGVALPIDAHPTAVSAASDQRLWIAYAETILRVDFVGGALAVTRAGGESVAARGRVSAVEEHQGIVWIGAARGLGRLTSDHHRVEWIDLEHGMPSRSVASILIDQRGFLWIPTNQGITRFEPSSRRAAHFGAVQGAQASGYVEGGAARGRSGMFYAAGRGITAFDPSRVRDNPHRPRVVFTTLEILHRPMLPSWVEPGSPLGTALHAAASVTLPPDAVVFSIEMASPGIADPDGVQFAHRLDGFDGDWIESTADRRVATYTRLSPGDYVMRARARTRSGVWSAEEATLRIRILPPWWRTPGAVAIWIAIAVLAAAALVHETRRRTRVRIALAEQEALRRASVTDPLTGLYNRRFLAAWLKHEIPRVAKSHDAAAGTERVPEFLLFIAADLDDLKKINDAYGHEAGDRAIRAVAGILQSQSGEDDVAVRLGGDEFLLVVRCDDRPQGAAIVERLRAAAERADLGLDLAAPPAISLGFASFPFIEHDVDALTWEQTLQLADLALLHAKRRGRNAWTGFAATPMTSAGAVLQLLDAGTERLPSAAIRVFEGPDEQVERAAR